ncbi:MAG: hypothetical protein J3K34DRAFT_425206 [Monoraphidium minutum]|nr:MAG: hypothetical protein J3K34DRAFT_425206 [Monoraphidium minutum]
MCYKQARRCRLEAGGGIPPRAAEANGCRGAGAAQRAARIIHISSGGGGKAHAGAPARCGRMPHVGQMGCMGRLRPRQSEKEFAGSGASQGACPLGRSAAAPRPVSCGCQLHTGGGELRAPPGPNRVRWPANSKAFGAQNKSKCPAQSAPAQGQKSSRWPSPLL